jgi:hypothetical protein
MRKVQHGATSHNIQPTNKQPVSQCLVCCHDIEFFNVYEGCEHTDICWKCSLSMRVLLNDDTCCICKHVSKRVILTHTLPKTFSEYDLNSLKFDPMWNVYAESEIIIDRIKDLRDIKCRVCEHEHRHDEETPNFHFNNMHQLKNHVAKEHNLHYCILCTDNRKVFLKEQKLYTNREITTHVRFGEQDSQHGRIHGHPLCKFCNKRFYNDDDLFQHMYKKHERCHICERTGVQFEYYRDYNHLEKHFDSVHILCHDPICLEKKFIVFTNELDLRAHELKEHVGKGKRLTKKDKERYSRIDINTLGSTSQEQYQPQRRPLRVGEVNSSVIRFIDTSGDGYFNDNIINAPSQERYKRKKEDRRREPRANAPEPAPSLPPPVRPTEDQPLIPGMAQALIDPNESLESKRERNAMLVKRMKAALKDKNDFERFKNISKEFQQGNMLASDYYDTYVSIFGVANSKKLFVDLVALMPTKDEKRANALLLAHNAYHSKEFGQSKTSNKGKQVAEEEVEEAWPSLQTGPTHVIANTSNGPTSTKPKQKKPSTGSANWGAVDTDHVRKQKPKPPKTEDFPSLLGNSSAPVSNDAGVWGAAPPKPTTKKKEPQQAPPRPASAEPSRPGYVTLKKKKNK